MNAGEIKARQKAERKTCLDAILRSKARKKLIVAGPGTGKTYTFGQVLIQSLGGNNLAMTFIRKLVEDMEKGLARSAEVKTFHAYCKKILHQRTGRVELIPYLTRIIQVDAELLGNELDGFDTKIRNLDEGSPEVAFYPSRGDYYGAVSFDDSVYRLYRLLLADPDVVPVFDQIVIDEFQDFNPLEVAFITELEKRGPVLIVGDDDQAVYENRSASPAHLREKHNSGEYDIFTLPFCSRCPAVVVAATNAVIEAAQAEGHLVGRIPKPYECFLDDKESDSIKYPKIIRAHCTMASVIPKYILVEVSEIAPEDIAESHQEGKEYPTVLVVGQRQYLREVEKQLRPIYPHLVYAPSEEIGYGLIEGYRSLLKDAASNLGWRILTEVYFKTRIQRKIIADTQDGTPLIELLDPDFVDRHLKAIEIIRTVSENDDLTPESRATLDDVLGEAMDEVLKEFAPQDEVEEPEIDKSLPSIMLTSFVGSKGLSAGHVFIVGLHNGALPGDPHNIADIEISQFIVALTRTRKQCHLISNSWLASAMQNGKWLPRFTPSKFLSWVPAELTEHRGILKAANFR